MWSSIQQILKPSSFEEALAFKQNDKSRFFAGGSYLVASKDRHINTLIDLNYLLDHTVVKKEGYLKVGAGCTLQNLIPACNAQLVSVIRISCPSKNIRNQRTLGGEIVQARPDSDLLVYLTVAQTRIHVHGLDKTILLSDWNGKGIITELDIPLTNIKFERVAVLDSAPAYILVAVTEEPNNISIAIGGKTSRIYYQECSVETLTEERLKVIPEQVEVLFSDDHFGSPAYKRQVVSNLLHDMLVAR